MQRLTRRSHHSFAAIVHFAASQQTGQTLHPADDQGGTTSCPAFWTSYSFLSELRSFSRTSVISASQLKTQLERGILLQTKPFFFFFKTADLSGFCKAGGVIKRSSGFFRDHWVCVCVFFLCCFFYFHPPPEINGCFLAPCLTFWRLVDCSSPATSDKSCLFQFEEEVEEGKKKKRPAATRCFRGRAWINAACVRNL